MEPWLRGTITGLPAPGAHVFYTFEQVREELDQFCSSLTVEELWRKPLLDVASVGFHLRHMAGSVDRLTTYLRGEPLTEVQLAVLRHEQEPGPSYAVLLEELEIQFGTTEAVVRSLSPTSYEEARGVGRKWAPTSVGGLLVHISEHTQRHLGQTVLTAKIVRRLGMVAPALG